MACPRRAVVTFLADETALADVGHVWNVAVTGLYLATTPSSVGVPVLRAATKPGSHRERPDEI